MKQLKAGILGAGFMGKKHGVNLMKMEGVHVAAVCDQEEARAEELAKTLSKETKVYSDFSKMLLESCIDFLYICLPPFAHEGQLEAAAEKGIHVFIEKPIAINTARGLKMVEAVKKAGIISQVGYHMRFSDNFKKLKNLIESGEAGIPTLFDGRYECNSLHGKTWWMNKEQSGGQVIEQAIHIYDAAMYYLGEPHCVIGFLGNLCHRNVPGYTVEDTSVSAIRFKSGALANIAASNCAVPGEWNFNFTVVCEKLTAYFHGGSQAEFVYTNRQPPQKEQLESQCDPYFEESAAFVKAIRGEASNLCTIEEGYKSLRLAEAVVKSSEQGKVLLL